MTTRKESNTPFIRYAIPVLRGMAVGLAVCLGVLLIMALVLTIQDLPVSVASYLSVIALGIGAFVGGWTVSHRVKERGLLWGAVCGLLIFAALTLVGITFFSGSGGTSLWFRLAVSVLCGAIGGVLGVNARR